MSRTVGGYVFKCNVCGIVHILTERKPYEGIRIYCPIREKKSEEYKKGDFKSYLGMRPPFLFDAK